MPKDDNATYSLGYMQSLDEFGIRPEDVREPLWVAPGKYIVLILNKDLWATWETSDTYEPPKGAEKFLSRAIVIQSKPVRSPSKDDNLAFRRIVGAMITQALAGEFAEAESILRQAEQYVHARAGETSRFWYVQASLLTVGLFLAFGFLTELQLGWGGGVWEHVGLAMAFGAVGALFSFLSRLRKMDVDPGAGRTAHYTDAFVRILLGALGALVFAVGIRANFVLGFANASADENMWLLFVFSAAAGASERLVPDFLQQVESNAVQKDPMQGDQG